MTDDDDGFTMWVLIILGILLLFLFSIIGSMVYQELTANKICRDNGWADAEMVKPLILFGYYNYICQTPIQDKWTDTRQHNSTNIFKINKYKANPGKIE